MDVLLRAIAVIVEVVLLAAIAYAVLRGVQLVILDLGLGDKYQRIIALALATVGILLVVFFIAHLTIFYPPGP